MVKCDDLTSAVMHDITMSYHNKYVKSKTFVHKMDLLPRELKWEGQVSAWQYQLTISWESVQPVPAWVEEFVIPVWQPSIV